MSKKKKRGWPEACNETFVSRTWQLRTAHSSALEHFIYALFSAELKRKHLHILPEMQTLQWRFSPSTRTTRKRLGAIPSCISRSIFLWVNHIGFRRRKCQRQKTDSFISNAVPRCVQGQKVGSSKVDFNDMKICLHAGASKNGDSHTVTCKSTKQAYVVTCVLP